MGGSYCLSFDKKSYQNEQTVNVQISEEYIQEKNIPQTTNMDIMQKNLNTNEGNNNTGINNLNKITNHHNSLLTNNLFMSQKKLLKMRIVKIIMKKIIYNI